MLSDPQKRAAYDQYGHARVDPNMSGRGGPGGKASAVLPRPSATSLATSSAARAAAAVVTAASRSTAATT